MKMSIRVLLACMAVLMVGIVGAAIQQTDPVSTFQLIKQNAELMAVAPVILSASITPEMINDLKVKYGNVKLITVWVDMPVYDIDNIPFKDRVSFKELKIDYATLINRELPISERIKPLEDLKKACDVGDKTTLAKELSARYSGVEIEPGEPYQFIVRRPDRGMIKMLLPLAESRQIDDFADKAIKNLIVGGDSDSLEDGLVFMGVISQLKEMISPAQSFLSKA